MDSPCSKVFLYFSATPMRKPHPGLAPAVTGYIFLAVIFSLLEKNGRCANPKKCSFLLAGYFKRFFFLT